MMVRYLIAAASLSWISFGPTNAFFEAHSTGSLASTLLAARIPVKSLGRAGPLDPPPRYDETDLELLDRTLLGLFRSSLKNQIGYDSPEPGYEGLMDMVRVMASPRWGSASECQEASRRVSACVSACVRAYIRPLSLDRLTFPCEHLLKCAHTCIDV